MLCEDIIPRTDVPALTGFIEAMIRRNSSACRSARCSRSSPSSRVERRQRAEEMAAKAPTRIFPLVGCIFPSLFIVILGPAIILIALNLTV